MAVEAAVRQEEVPEENAGEDIAELDEDMKAAIEGAAQPSPSPEEDEDGEDEAEHLKDLEAGSFRMKRLLECDGDDGKDAKKAKIQTPEEGVKNKLMVKWGLQGDMVIKYVLNNLDLEELKALDTTNYYPDKNHWQKSAPDLLQRHCVDCRERKTTCGGSSLDVVSTFKFRFKLDASKDKVLRSLSHKDLRYVLNNFDGTKTLEEVIKEASEYDDEEQCTESACPAGPGVSTIGRFGRLELIDGCADAAVFGDANLTFALKLAKHRRALGHVGRVIATTFEDLETLQQRYPEINDSIKTLEDHYAEVHHGVDCTRIGVDSRFDGMKCSLGAAYYNFPHSGAVGGFFDGHPLVNWRHENLMRLFFRALRSVMKPGGTVKVASNMGAVGVRYSYIVNSAVAAEFIHVETMPFMEWHLHRYGRSYGDRRDAYKRPDAQNNQSYNAQNGEKDMVYCFAYAPTGEKISTENMIVTPPNLKTLQSCVDGPFKSLVGEAKKNLAQQLRKRFVTEASGTHVG